MNFGVRGYKKSSEAVIPITVLMILIVIWGCTETQLEETSPFPKVGKDVVVLPVVVHVLHNGEPIGEGPNLTEYRIRRQIEILNEDFRRKEGTRGFNTHPSGADAMMEFVLARTNPEGQETSGINRIDISDKKVMNMGYSQNHFAQYDYWPPHEYINIWVTPLTPGSVCLALGKSTGPDTDLPGVQYLPIPRPGDAEGILVNWIHFGESEINCQARFGRTLTHEMGHYFGLLHTWGVRDCIENDFCDDTPAVDNEVYGRMSFQGCEGDSVMIGNYMNYSDDDIMNIFTKDQVSRMHYVLNNHDGRRALMISPGLHLQ